MKYENAMEIYTFQSGNTAFTYELWRGNYKNINLRIKPDGKIRISTPQKLTNRQINRFISDHLDFILHALSNAKTCGSQKSENPYANGEKIAYLGRWLTLRIQSTNSESFIELNETTNELCLYLSSRSSKTGIERLIKNWKKERLKEQFALINSKMPEKFAAYMKNSQKDLKNVSFIGNPTDFQVKSVKGYWGKCMSSKGVIILNLWLINTPPECIEYVIVHENAHFLQANHSPAFHQIMSAVLSDWKERKKELKHWSNAMY